MTVERAKQLASGVEIADGNPHVRVHNSIGVVHDKLDARIADHVSDLLGRLGCNSDHTESDSLVPNHEPEFPKVSNDYASDAGANPAFIRVEYAPDNEAVGTQTLVLQNRRTEIACAHHCKELSAIQSKSVLDEVGEARDFIAHTPCSEEPEVPKIGSNLCRIHPGDFRQLRGSEGSRPALPQVHEGTQIQRQPLHNSRPDATRDPSTVIVGALNHAVV